jgi:5-methylcytosine-specific restriction endonuclease McrA
MCAAGFAIYRSHANRSECCSRRCAGQFRSQRQSGSGNANWAGGVSRLPYPWNFREISKQVIERDGGVCRNPGCAGTDPRLTTHHIDYDKTNCSPDNLIALCSACNSKANFGRDHWQVFYTAMMVT